MLRCVALLALAATVAADGLSLPGGYLPPQCPPPPAPVTVYKSQYVTSTVVRRVVKTDLRYETVQVVSSRLVPSEIVTTNVRAVPTYVYTTKVITDTSVRYSTKVVQIPGNTKVVQRPMQKVAYKEVVTDVYSTFVTTLVRPTTLVNTNIVTKVNVETKYVPKYMQAATTVIVPGPTQYVTKPKTVLVTQVATTQLPAVYSTSYKTVYNTKYSTVRIPGSTKTAVTTEYQRRPVVKTEVRYSERVITETVRQQVPVEVTVTKTQYTTQVVPKVIYSSKVVPRYVTKTQVVDVPRPVIVTNTQYITKRVPAYPVIRSVYDTKVVYTTLPGQVRQQVQYRTVTDYKTVTATSTQIVPKYTTKTETVKKPCGYSYPEPQNPFNF